MTSPKETVIMALAVTGTVFGMASTLLHFTHLSHDSPKVVVNSQDIVNVPFTADDLSTTQKGLVAEVMGNTFPKYIHLKAEPINTLYELNYPSYPSKNCPHLPDDCVRTATFRIPPSNQTVQITLIKSNKEMI